LSRSKRLVTLLASGAALCLALMACSSSTFPIVPSDNLVREGREVYEAHCVFCHGDESGQNRQHGAPPHNVEGHTWHHPDRQLFEWVLDGPPLRTEMPTFRGQLSEREVVAALAYIKTFWPENIRSNQIAFSRSYEEQVSNRR
jgi:mono/diheme cytochrome c family protein